MYIVDIVAVTLSILILVAWVWISVELNKVDKQLEAYLSREQEELEKLETYKREHFIEGD